MWASIGRSYGQVRARGHMGKNREVISVARKKY